MFFFFHYFIFPQQQQQRFAATLRNAFTGRFRAQRHRRPIVVFRGHRGGVWRDWFFRTIRGESLGEKWVSSDFTDAMLGEPSTTFKTDGGFGADCSI
jgi:hypothetical protein